MNRSQIKELQAHVGTEADGFWGPKSLAACQKHLRSLMPSPNPWPKSDQRSLTSFYGAAGDTDNMVSVDAPSWMRLYDGHGGVRKITCHRKVADSLLRALDGAYKASPKFARRYFGCYVNRKMRGGSSPSLHARGAAIDLSATGNGLHTHWPTRATMPIGVMEAFAREGWLSAGAFWSRDAMHFQSTQ